jgi:hypothetical protein
MSIQVTGLLVDPIGNPMETSIRITSQNSKVAIKGSHATIVTGVGGTYDFNLEEGLYLVQLLQKKEYTGGVVVLVDDTVIPPITLGSLLDNHEGQL